MATWLSEFDFAIKYVPGKKNVVADGLSRAAAGGPPEEDEKYAGRLLSAVVAMAPIPVRARDAAARDAEYTALLARTDEELASLKRVKADGLLYYARGPR
jgi:truncated hemoglobin YjbI